MENKGKCSGWIVAIIFIFMIVAISSCSRGCSSDSDKFDEFDAQVVAESEVKENLKSPSTADFSPYSETTITNDGDEWTVKGWVDAQNGFGAMIRSTYIVKFTMTGTDRYIVDYCYVN